MGGRRFIVLATLAATLFPAAAVEGAGRPVTVTAPALLVLGGTHLGCDVAVAAGQSLPAVLCGLFSKTQTVTATAPLAPSSYAVYIQDSGAAMLRAKPSSRVVTTLFNPHVSGPGFATGPRRARYVLRVGEVVLIGGTHVACIVDGAATAIACSIHARSGAAVPGSFAVLINAQVAAISRVSKNGTTSVVLTKREG